MSSIGSAVILIDLPPKTFIGINLVSFNSSPNFQGISNLPTGLQFLYSGVDASLSIRHGRWLRTTPKYNAVPTHVLKWNFDFEQLFSLHRNELSASDVKRYLERAQSRGLVDYNALQDASFKLKKEQDSNVDRNTEETEPDNVWGKLTSHITPRLLDRVLLLHTEPTAGSGDDQTVQPWMLSSISSAPADSESIPGLTEKEVRSALSSNETTLNLISVDLKQTWPSEAVGRERTEKARDRSWYLGHLIDAIAEKSSTLGNGAGDKKQHGARELLGELQFCFIMVLTLGNYSCFEQWKRILSVLFSCKSALMEIEAYFAQAVKILHEQLNRVEDVEGGLFELKDEMGSAWLRRLLHGFRANVDEMLTSKNSELPKALEDLEMWLREQYGWEDERNVLRRGMIQLEDGEMVEMEAAGWDEEEETGEYAPAIVET